MTPELTVSRPTLWQEPWLVLGDSITKGITYDPVKNRYHQLKNSFVEKIKSDLNLSVLNLSVFGATIKKGLKQLQRHGDQLVKGGIALLQFGGNDCDFNWAAISRDPAADHLPQVPLKDFIQQYKLLIQRLSDLGYQPLVLNLPPLIQDRFFATVSKGLAADTILEWLGGTTDSIYYWHQSYSDAVEQMALKAKLPLIDIRTVFEGEPQVEDLVCEDGIHPNEKGHALIARTLKAYR